MKPNIIFIFSDQQRPDTMGIYGQSLPVTPCLDSLARDGVWYQNAFTVNPVCGPARSSLQTGLYPTASGCFRNDKALPKNAHTITHSLKDNGYHTAYIGKWHLASDSENNHRTSTIPADRRGGYDYWMAADVLEFTSNSRGGYVFNTAGEKVEFTGYRADCITDFAVDYLKTAKKEKPFFLFVSYIEPHHQNNANRYEGPEGSKEKWSNYTVPGDLIGKGGDWKESYPDYLGCCNAVDSGAGRIINTLKEKGIYENTVIIYASDHGSHFRTRNEEYKRSCHENSIHIPLIIRGGNFRGGKRVDQLVSLIDIPSTILSIAGGKPLPLMHGNDLTKNQSHETVFVQISESQVGRAVRDKRYKYSVHAPELNGWHDSCSSVYVDEFLYDLQKDPYEQKNLVSDPNYRKIKENLRKKLVQKMIEYGEAAPEIKEAQQ